MPWSYGPETSWNTAKRSGRAILSTSQQTYCMSPSIAAQRLPSLLVRATKRPHARAWRCTPRWTPGCHNFSINFAAYSNLGQLWVESRSPSVRQAGLLYPNSGHGLTPRKLTLCAKSGSRPRLRLDLANDVRCTCEQGIGNWQTKALRRLHVDHHVELTGLLDGQVAGVGPLQDTGDKRRGTSVQ
jgi:hypothetical protein